MNNSLPLISIVTVCRNAQDIIEKTILSVINQSCKNYEFIIIDGNSQDETLKIIDRYKEHIDIIISEPDTGIYNAQNKGALQAKGEYLLFLNAGDYLYESISLDKIAPHLDDIEIAYCGVELIHSDKSKQHLFYPEFIPHRYWFNNYICHQATIIRRKLLIKHGLYNERYKFAADHDFLYKVWYDPEVSKKSVHILLSTYDMSGVSSSMQNRSIILKELDQSRRRNFPFHIYLFEVFKSIVRKNGLNTRLSFIIKLYGLFLRSSDAKSENNSKIPFYFAQDESRPKVAIINTYDDSGGAARAAVRIFKCINSDFAARMIVAHRTKSDPNIVLADKKTILGKIRNRILRKRIALKSTGSFRTNNPILHSYDYASPYDIPGQVRKMEPDLIHMHWITHELLTIEDIARLKKPLIWTMHDMWPFCGAEHVAYNERFIEGYPDRNRPEGETGFNLNKWVWRRKYRSYKKIRKMVFTAPSNWMVEQARKSPLLKGREVVCIPNPLDTDEFSPRSRSESRLMFNIPQNAKVILFGAMDPLSEVNKGYNLLMKSLEVFTKNIDTSDNYIFVMFGHAKTDLKNIGGISVINVGYLRESEKLSALYSAADVMVVPSLIESFGQVASEAMSCGTPVACFDTSGLRDIVDHKMNGYRATCYLEADLANGIKWILDDSERWKSLSQAAREKVINNFSSKSVTSQFVALYKKMLSNKVL